MSDDKGQHFHSFPVHSTKQRTFQVELSTSFEGLVDQLECLPHCGRDALGGKSTAIDDLKDLVVQIYQKKISPDQYQKWHSPTYRRACSPE